jgi:hypothetical protein
LADSFTKHHPSTHHKSVHPTILTSINNPEYTKLFKKPTATEKFEPQIKTLVATKSFVKNLLKKPRFKTMTSNTFTAKSA